MILPLSFSTRPGALSVPQKGRLLQKTEKRIAEKREDCNKKMNGTRAWAWLPHSTPKGANQDVALQKKPRQKRRKKVSKRGKEGPGKKDLGTGK